MAASITINSQPQEYTNVYNEEWFNILSTNVAQQNFKYICQVFTGLTTSTTASTLVYTGTYPPDVNASTLTFNPNRIFESYVGHDKNIQNIISCEISSHINRGYVYFGEEYGPTNAIVQFTGITASNPRNFFKGVQQYYQLPSWDYTQYVFSGAPQIASKFLTNQPDNKYIKKDTDRETISFFQGIGRPGETNIFLYTLYPNSGGSIQYKVKNTTVTGSTTGSTYSQIEYKMQHVPAGIWNINNISPSTFSGLAIQPILDPCTINYYTIQGQENGTAVLTTELRTYVIDRRYSKFPGVRFMWLNPLGGYDYFTFTLLRTKTINSTKYKYKKVLSPSYTVGDFETTVFDGEGKYSYTVQSDWLSDAELLWLPELITSQEVWTISDSGILNPVIITTEMQKITNKLNDKLSAYNFTYETAYKINTQRA